MTFRSRGRPKFEPTGSQRLRVAVLVACGNPRGQVAASLGIDTKTLRKCFAREIREAKKVASGRMAAKLYEAGMAGNIVAQIFWLKTQAGWRETAGLELSGPDGKPLSPPKLGISFSSGGPGHAIEVTTGSSNIEHLELHGQDEPIEKPRREAIEHRPVQTAELLPEQNPTRIPLWERLAMDPAEFARLQQNELEPERYAHEHHASADSICPKCRALWVAQ